MADDDEGDGDVTMVDGDGDAATDDGQEHHQDYRDEDLDEKFPNRPRNHSATLPFHELFLTLFNPLQENRKKPTGPVLARKKQGPHGSKNLTPNEVRRQIVERFIGRWRKQVGNDIYPAFRLIVPEKDRDRAMYGLKEKTIAKMLVRMMKIDKNSEDGQNLLNWKLPGIKAASAMAGDFAGRCFEVIKKRPMRTQVGDLTIGEVNEMLDQLSAAQKEENQLPIFEEFYKKMNAEELTWLIRMILRQMKVGATEKTIFDIWHPDAENLFNVSSSLRRVCWELYDPQFRLDSDDRGINIMQCFQPQLAAFQMRSMETMVARMNPTELDPVFWIEEKLDGERMQLHMIEDDNVPGGKRFAFWSRKAKDYTYLYGSSFQDDSAALTRHIKQAFDENVRNIILDGEMITWDPQEDAQVAFGSLKTAALSEQRNPFAGGHRPLYKVFDCLYLNDKVLTNYTLRDRRKALQTAISDVHRRLEIHAYTEAQSAAEIEPILRQVVADASEGLVLKNPRSMYRLNERNDDWIKVKPEYMTEFGEALDCVVIGGYYGSGHRGGKLSSFLCGLRMDQNQIAQGASPKKCFSFFKVGGGFSATDYAEIRHATDGKWLDWDPRKPPTEYIELAGGDRQFERPDVWIKVEDSVVLEVKAAQVTTTETFRIGYTLRFPRFKRLRKDKDWTSALTINEFGDLKSRAETEKAEKQFKIDDARHKKRARTTRKKQVTLAGGDNDSVPSFTGPHTKLFEGLSFYVLTECMKPKTSKDHIEQMVKSHGGKIVQTQRDKETICIADRNVVKVASIKKTNEHNLIRPTWIFDCIRQTEIDIGRPAFLLPIEPSHLLHAKGDDLEIFAAHVDEYGDSYTRDTTADDLRLLLTSMKVEDMDSDDYTDVLAQISEDLSSSPGFLFRGLRVFVVDAGTEPTDGDAMALDTESRDGTLVEVGRLLSFGGAVVADRLDETVTHVLFGSDQSRLRDVRRQIAGYRRVPRLVQAAWVEDSWRERTLLDEERYVPR